MGLVSIWATEETGGEKPSGGDSRTSKTGGHNLESRWSKPITSKSRIESRWASSDNETKEEVNVSPQKDRRSTNSHNDVHAKPHFNKRDGHKGHEKGGHHRNKDFSKQHQKGRSTDSGVPSKHREQNTPGDDYVEDSDDKTVVSEKLYSKGPMTDAARSLAARITVASKSKEAEAEADDATAWEEVSEDEEEDVSVRDRKAPQGKTLAERLDSFKVSDTKQKTPRGNTLKQQERRGFKKDVSRPTQDNAPRGSKSKVSTTKTRPQDDQAAKEKEEKEKQDLLKMIEEFESQKLDWASFEE
ncbi:hypothetical protein KGF57_002347 [Candida theae]|uniref:Uncharacterized protein n=1 Tax=Candida theae TaxID=1198502 RepID=A0AAD5FZ64_9ASCO|nr:uncharacterized protein KGF57_002347 [Candida theae]KAI5958913.1 hypothetical protein KGF57_002347 [Candida theae]